MPEYRPTSNMLQLIRMLESTHTGRLRVNDVAERLGVNRRSVTRWLKALEADYLDDTGEPIVRKEQHGREAWAVLTGAHTVLTTTIFQYAAALAAARSLESGEGTLLSDSAHEVLARVQGGLRDHLQVLVPRVWQGFHYVPFAPKNHRIDEDTLDDVVQAVIRRHPLELDYTTALGASSHRRLHAWSLVMYRDGLYVLGPSEDNDALRLYAIERMDAVRLDRRSTFYVPPDFDPRAAFGEQLGLWRTEAPATRVVVAFDAGAGTVLRSRAWPGLWSLETGEDGRLYLTLDVPITPEIESWILGWGALAEVVQPASLRARIREEVSKLAENYSE